MQPNYGAVFAYRIDPNEESRLRAEQEEIKLTIENAQQQKKDIRKQLRNVRTTEQNLQRERVAARTAYKRRKSAEAKIVRKRKKLGEIKAELAQVNSDRDIASIATRVQKIQLKYVQRKYCVLSLLALVQ